MLRRCGIAVGEGHPATVRVLATLVQVYGQQGKLPEADALVRRHIAWMRTTVAPNDLDLADAIASLAISLHRQSLWSEAEPLLREAESMMRANQTPQPMTAQMTWRLGDAQAKQGRFAESEPLLLEGWRHISDESSIEIGEKRENVAALVDMYSGHV